MKPREGSYIATILPCDCISTIDDAEKKLVHMRFSNNSIEGFELVAEVNDNLEFPFDCNFFSFLESKGLVWKSYSELLGVKFEAEVFYEDFYDEYPAVIFTDVIDEPKGGVFYEIHPV